MGDRLLARVTGVRRERVIESRAIDVLRVRRKVPFDG